MKIRAAVLEEFGAPLAVQEVELAEPGPGEVLVRLDACGVCHTDLYTASGADPSGYAPDRARPRGRRRRRARRRGRRAPSPRATTSSRCSRPSAASASTAGRPRTNLCLAIREQQNLGYLPDGTTRLSRDGEPIRHFMGTLDVRRVHGDAGDRAGEDQPRGAARPRLPVRLRPLDRPRRGDEHRQGRGGLDLRRVRRRHGRPRRGRRLPPRRAPSGSSASTCREDRLELATRPGRDRDDGRRRRRGRSRSST